MNLSQEEIDSFRKAWEEDFRENVSVEVAAAELQRLLTFLHLLTDGLFGPATGARPLEPRGDTMEQ